MALKRRRPGLVYPTWEDWHYVGATDEPAFQNSWGNLGGSYPSMAFRAREAGVVDLIGVLSRSGSSTSIITTLPVGYRPSELAILVCKAQPASGVEETGVLGIQADGDIQLYSSAAQYIYFSGSFFLNTAAP